MSVGKTGERLVGAWASSVDITVNRSEEDEFGWDYCFQFAPDPKASAAMSPMDLAPPHITCWVQVKATAVGEKARSVKLSNWKKMVDDPLPWFFVHVSLDVERNPVEASLVHVDERWIEKVMRRLRELEPGDNGLHKHTLNITWTEADALVAPYPEALKAGIRKAVGDPDRYFLRKLRFRQSVGYADQPNREAVIRTGLFRESELDTETIVDFAIGLTDRLRISGYQTADTRFGIRRAIARELSQAFMHFADGPPSVGKSNLIFSNAKGAHTTIAFETYTPTLLLGDLPPESVKVRFQSNFMRVLGRPKSETLTASWNLPEDGTLAPLGELSDACAALLLFASAAPDNEVLVTCERQGRTFPIGFTREANELPTSTKKLAIVAQHAAVVACEFGLAPDTLIDPSDIHDQARELTAMRAVLERQGADLQIGVVAERGAEAQGKRTAIVYMVAAKLGDHVLAMIVSHNGVGLWRENEDTVWIDQPRKTDCLEKWVTPLSDWKDAVIGARALAWAEKLRSQFDQVIHPPVPETPQP